MFLLFLVLSGESFGITVHLQDADFQSDTILNRTLPSLGGALTRSNITMQLLEKPDETFILVSGKKVLFNSLKGLDTRSGDIIVSGSTSCISDCNKYFSNVGKYPFLDSSVVIGRGSELASLNFDELQGELSSRYLSDDKTIVLDRNGNIMAPITGKNMKKVSMKFGERNNSLTLDGVEPRIAILSSPKATPIFLEISRYMGNGVTKTTCHFCKRSSHVAKKYQQPLPSLFIVVHAIERVPFVYNLLKTLSEMRYDRSKIEVLIYCTHKQHELRSFYHPYFKQISFMDKVFVDEEHDVRHHFLRLFAESEAERFVYLDTTVHITSHTIPDLLSLELPLIAPLLRRQDVTAWSNFWASFTPVTWNYLRSSDYANILTRTIRGVFPVSCVRNIYLINRSLALSLLEWEAYDRAHLQPEISMCKTLYERSVPVFLSNEQDWGRLKNSSEIPDLLLWRNRTQDWESKYLAKIPRAEDFADTGCSNVFLAKGVLTPEFGQDMVHALLEMGEYYESEPSHHIRPSYDITKTPYNQTLVEVVLHLTGHLISDIFPGFTPKHQLYDIRISKVEGDKLTRKNQLKKGHSAAYQVILPLNDAYTTPEDETLGYRFPRQNCTVTGSEPGDILLYPGMVTHRVDVHSPTVGVLYYLGASFDSKQA